jgi:thiol-disulfide isomerase/thioredoxin
VSEPKKTDRMTWVFVAVLLVGAVLMGWQETSVGIMPEGTEAPLFIVDRLSGPPIELSALKGKVVVVNFWATWCPPCREEIPYLIQAVKDSEAKGVTLVAISNDELNGQREAVTEFLKAYPGLAPYAALGRPEIGFAYQVKALPSVFIIDREGRVRASHQGQASERQLRRWIEEAVEPDKHDE